MILNDTVYDWSMTLIIAAHVSDGVVMVGDGKVTTIGEDEVQLDQRKIFHINNGVFFGIAANYLYEGEIENLAKHMKLHLPLSPPYKMEDVIKDFVYIIEHTFDEKPSDFKLNFIIGGYSRNALGRTTEPFVGVIEKHPQGYIAKKTAGAFAVGDLDREVFADTEFSKNIDEAIGELQSWIRRSEAEFPRVGGDIQTVIIRDVGKKKFKELIKRASQPVPKEQDKQLTADSYSGKQTRQRKTEGTSDSRRGKSHQ